MTMEKSRKLSSFFLLIMAYLAHANNHNTCQLTNVKESNLSYFLIPSQVVACNKRVPLNVENFTSYIRSVHEVFRMNDGLYHTRLDPLGNVPLNYQPELGYSVYFGANEGQVDINASLQEIVEIVEAEDEADASLFWNVSKVFMYLKDGHVAVTLAPLGKLNTTLFGSVTHLSLIAKKSFENDLRYHYRPFFELEEDGEIQMRIVERDSTTLNEVEKLVNFINHMTPKEFLTFVAVDSGIASFSKDASGNVNNVITSKFNSKDFQSELFSALILVPPDTFPDELEIEYKDGAVEILVSRIIVSVDEIEKYIINENSKETDSGPLNTLTVDLSLVEDEINQKGLLRKTVSDSVENLVKGLSVCGLKNDRYLKTSDIPPKEKILQHVQEDSAVDTDTLFDGIFVNCTAITGQTVWMYKFIDDYTLLKAPTFDPCIIWLEVDIVADFFTETLQAWEEMIKESKARGSKKLMIDFSNNGGGSVRWLYSLLMLMFPDIDTKYILNVINVPYNKAMKVVADEFDPLMAELVNVTLNDPDKMQLAVDYVVENNLFCYLETIYDSFLSMYGFNDGGMFESILKAPFYDFQEKKTVESLNITFWNGIINFYSDYNPLTVAGGFDAIMAGSVPEEVIRGGRLVEFLLNTTFEEDPYWASIQEFAKSLDHSFDEYLLLSNGVCGSACDQFVTTSMQLWRNKDITGADKPVTVVTYGGNGEPVDPSQFAGGFVKHPPIVNNYGPLLITLFIFAVTNQTKYLDFYYDFLEKIPTVPYYLNSWPSMPVVELVSNIMMPSAVPIDFLRKSPDYYISKIFTATTYEYSFELDALYGNASTFFVTNNVGKGQPSAATQPKSYVSTLIFAATVCINIFL